MTDEQYIEAIRANNQQALSELYNEFHGYFFNTLSSLILEPFGAKKDYIESLYHDAIIILWEKARNQEFNINSSLRNYLIGIGKFKHLSYNRKKISDKAYAEEMAKIGEVTDFIIDDEQNEIIDKLVETLGEPCSSLLRMFYWEKLSGDEIVQSTSYKNRDSVKSQKSKCMTKIKTAANRFIKMGLL